MTMVTEIRQRLPAVGQSQAQFLDTWFAPILALRGRVNFRHLRRYCDYGERTMARQCRRCFAWPDVHQRVITVALDPRSAVISAQDASFIPKRGKPPFGLGHCFNGGPSRAACGLELSTLAVVEVTRRGAFTLAVAQTPPGDDATVSPQTTEETSVDVSRQQLRAQRHRVPPQVTSHRRFSRPENDSHFSTYFGLGYGYANVTGRWCNQGIGGHALSRAASRRSGLWARLSNRTTIRSAWISSCPPVSTAIVNLTWNGLTVAKRRLQG